MRRELTVAIAVLSGTCCCAQADLFPPEGYQDPSWMAPWYAQVHDTKAWADWLAFAPPVDGEIAATNHGWNYSEELIHKMPYVSPLGTTHVSDDGTHLVVLNGHLQFFARLFNKADPNKDKHVYFHFRLRSPEALGLSDTWAIHNGTTLTAVGGTPSVATNLTYNPRQFAHGDEWIDFYKEWVVHPQPAEEKMLFDVDFGNREIWADDFKFATACPAPGALMVLGVACLASARRRL